MSKKTSEKMNPDILVRIKSSEIKVIEPGELVDYAKLAELRKDENSEQRALNVVTELDPSKLKDLDEDNTIVIMFQYFVSNSRVKSMPDVLVVQFGIPTEHYGELYYPIYGEYTENILVELARSEVALLVGNRFPSRNNILISFVRTTEEEVFKMRNAELKNLETMEKAEKAEQETKQRAKEAGCDNPKAMPFRTKPPSDLPN